MHTHTRHTWTDDLQIVVEACHNGKSFVHPILKLFSNELVILKIVSVYKVVILQIVFLSMNKECEEWL